MKSEKCSKGKDLDKIGCPTPPESLWGLASGLGGHGTGLANSQLKDLLQSSHFDHMNMAKLSF